MVKEFLMYYYFKIKGEETKVEQFKKTAERAYLDLCRTIRFNTDDETTKLTYKAKVCDMLVSEYNSLCDSIKSCNDFDREHRRICKAICDEYKAISSFTYGQAQKWVNMAFKYMFLIEGNSVLKPYLHIPVDSYILQSVGLDKTEYSLNLTCIPKKNGGTGRYSESSSKPWSKWEYEEYIAFQNEVRTAIEDSDFDSAIEWEHSAWIEVAEYRNIKERL